MKMSHGLDVFQLSAALLQPCDVEVTAAEWRAAEAEGWDMSLVMDSLRKPVPQRMHEHRMALAQAESLRATFVHGHGAA